MEEPRANYPQRNRLEVNRTPDQKKCSAWPAFFRYCYSWQYFKHGSTTAEPSVIIGVLVLCQSEVGAVLVCVLVITSSSQPNYTPLQRIAALRRCTQIDLNLWHPADSDCLILILPKEKTDRGGCLKNRYIFNFQLKLIFNSMKV